MKLLYQYRKITLALSATLMSIAAIAQNPADTVSRPVAATPVTAPTAYPGNVRVNYVRTWRPSMAFTDANTLRNDTDLKNVKQQTAYFDGLGRPLQTVEKSISPNGKDIVTPTVYDVFGRERYKYLPYESTTGNGQFKNDPFGEAAGFYPAQYPGENIFYGITEAEASPLNRVVKTMKPGNSWAGSGRGTSMEYAFNTVADSVKIWDIGTGSTDYPIARASDYPAGTLSRTTTTDEAGHKVAEYTDKDGRIVLKKVQADNSVSDGYAGWLATYYVYDRLGNLRYVIPPLAVKALIGNGWSLADATLRKELCFRYAYDDKRRMTVKQVPGTDSVVMLYDVGDRMVMSQDGLQRATNKWMVTLYDGLDRPVMTGLYTTTQSVADLQSLLRVKSAATTITYEVKAPTSLETNYHDGRSIYRATEEINFKEGFDSETSDDYESGGNFDTEVSPSASLYTEHTIVTNSLPGLQTVNLEPLTYNYYDHYDFNGKKTPINGSPYYEGAGHVDNLPVFHAAAGRLTGTKVKLLDGSNTWLNSTTYYDERGRVRQTVSDNATGGTETTLNLYDFEGRTLATIRNTQNRHAAHFLFVTVTRMYYDDAGRLLKVTSSIVDDEVTIAENSYDAIGQLKQKNFKRKDGSVLESLEYNYNIRGWLSAINKDYVNGGSGHYFGQINNFDFGFTTPQYNGNLSGIKWRGASGPARSYGYLYDASNRLLQADFMEKSSIWANNPSVNYDVLMGNGTTADSAYDANGNILRMQQWGGATAIDDLRYHYIAGTNRLRGVVDGVANPSSTIGDFKEPVQDSQDYAYDVAGNMVSDANKGIDNISYNHLGLPVEVMIPGRGKVSYLYDANGVKHRKTIVEAVGSVDKTTKVDYVGEAIFENDTLQQVSHPEGRFRPDSVAYVVDYFVKDHLGNVRMVLGEQQTIYGYRASMETQESAKENALFSNIDATRTAKPAGYPQDGENNAYVAKLNGKDKRKRIGPSLVLKVMPGDTVSIGTKAFYKSTGSKTPPASAPLADMAAAMTQAFAGAAGMDNHASASSQGRQSPLSGAFSESQYQRLQQRDADGQPSARRPKAYLNFVLFNDQFKLVEENSGVRQVQEAPDQLQTLSAEKIVMKESGFLYVYESNETEGDVFFDNLTVVTYPGAVLEEIHYYPYGLIMDGISSRALGKLENKVRFNGYEQQSKEFSNGSGLEWYDYKNRFYDNQVGRFFGVDRLAADYSHYTPYQFAGNEVPNAIDLDGLEPYRVDKNGVPFQAGDNLRTKLDPEAKYIYFPQGSSAAADAMVDAQAVALDVVLTVAPIGGLAKSVMGLVKLGRSAPNPGSNSGGNSTPTTAQNVEPPATVQQPVETSPSLTTASEKPTVKIETPYKRPNNATTKEQRNSVQGKPCVDCGKTENRMVADHKKPIVEEYYETGTIDQTRMKDVNAVQPQCPTCSQRQGRRMQEYSREQKKKHGL